MSNFTGESTNPVSRNPRQTKKKFKRVKIEATQMGRSGENRELISGSASFPPMKAPRIKEKPAITEKSPKFFTLTFSFSLKSATAVRQIDMLLENSPVMSLPK